MSPCSRHPLGTLLLLATALAVLTPAEAQEPRRRRPPRPPSSQSTSGPTTSSQATTTSTSTSAADEADKDRYLAVTSGRVFTVTGPVLAEATIVAKNGKILAIGQNLRLPPECEVVDAKGCFVYPGLVAAGAGGIHGGGNPADTTDVFNLNMQIALAGGITTALACDTAAKLTRGSVEDILLRGNLYVDLRYSRRRPLERALLRTDLEKVREHLRQLQQHEIDKAVDPEAKPPDAEWIKGKYQQYLKLLKREAVAVVGANSADELRDVADLAQTYGFRLVVRGAVEGWVVADVLGRAGVSAVVTPRSIVDANPRLARPNGSTIENAKILVDHGVPVAVVPETTGITTWGVAGRDLLHLNMEAGFAVRGGMSNDEALRTITIDAARILGVDDRVGSLEIGKDADIVVADGDILDYMTQVRCTIVNGRVAYDKAKTSLYAHIRPSGEVAPVEFDDQWPRALEWPEE